MKFQDILPLESWKQSLVRNHQPTPTVPMQETLPQMSWTLRNHSSLISARILPQAAVHVEDP